MDSKLKCLLLDDELPGLSYLRLLCEQIPELEVVRAFNDPEIFLNDVHKIEFDICILDIEMPGINGIQVAQSLKNKPVIFTTAYKEYAADAFDLDAIDYVLKPVKFERLKQAVNKALIRVEKDLSSGKFITLNTDKGNALVYFNQLVYISTSEVDSRDKVAHLNNGTDLILKNISFEKLRELLPPGNFCRINKKEMISLNKVSYFSADQITVYFSSTSEKTAVLTLGETYRIDFIRRFKK